jgi:hypothetical protein
MLDLEHYELLRKLWCHQGRLPIAADHKAKTCARHLVSLGYATTTLIPTQAFAIEITQQGCVAKILADFGILNPDFCAIELQPSTKDDQWLIKVSTVGNPPTLMEIAEACQLVAHLSGVGAATLAARFHAEIRRAEGYVKGRLRAEF